MVCADESAFQAEDIVRLLGNRRRCRRPGMGVGGTVGKHPRIRWKLVHHGLAPDNRAFHLYWYVSVRYRDHFLAPMAGAEAMGRVFHFPSRVVPGGESKVIMRGMRLFRGVVAEARVNVSTTEVSLPETDGLSRLSVAHDALVLRLEGADELFMLRTMDASLLFIGSGDALEIVGKPDEAGGMVWIYGVRNLSDGALYQVHPEDYRRWRVTHVMALMLSLPAIALICWDFFSGTDLSRRELLLGLGFGPGVAYGSYLVVELLGLRGPGSRVHQPGDGFDFREARALLGFERFRRIRAVKL